MPFDFAPIPTQDEIADKDGFITQSWIEYFNSTAQAQATSAQGAGSASIPTSTASIATTDLGVTTTAGRYRIGYYMEVVTAAGVSSSMTITFTWTSAGVSKTFTGAVMNGNTTTTYQQDTLFVSSDASAPITYSLAYASNPGAAAQYALYISLESMP